jgi:hypothetical protein
LRRKPCWRAYASRRNATACRSTPTLALMFDALATAFWAEPFKVLLGGSGVFGLVAIGVRWWNGRARPRVRLLGHTYENETRVRVEIENIGREPTSVEPSVPMSCRYLKGPAIRGEFKIQENDRTLAPVVPRTFVLVGRPPDGFIFSHFREYQLRFTRGGLVRVRVLNASGATAGPVKFFLLKWLYVFTGALPHVEG